MVLLAETNCSDSDKDIAASSDGSKPTLTAEVLATSGLAAEAGVCPTWSINLYPVSSLMLYGKDMEMAADVRYLSRFCTKIDTIFDITTHNISESTVQ